MSFQVRSASPMDDDWLERDDQIIVAAGRPSEFSGSCLVENCQAGCAGRTHGWHVDTFDKAVLLKERLERIPLVRATIREKTTHQRSSGWE